MTICIIILFFMIVMNLGFAGNGYFDDYLERDQTTAIKGIFVIMVFLRHFHQYVHLHGAFNKPFVTLDHYSGQLIVAMFLFYSGYGIICSMKKKGPAYIKSLPTNKVLRLLVRFDIVVACFLGLETLLGKHFAVRRIVEAFFGWRTVGNSNWYIFAMLACYFCTWVAFTIAGVITKNSGKSENRKLFTGVIILSVLLVLYCIVMAHFKGDSPRFYNTIYCYVAGMCYALGRKKIEKFLKKSAANYYLTVLAEIAVFGILCVLFLKTRIMVLYIILAAVFSVLVVHLTMKFKISNLALILFGNYVFEIYILQRLPMIAFRHVSAIYSNVYVYLIACAVTTAVLSVVYRKIEDKIL